MIPLNIPLRLPPPPLLSLSSPRLAASFSQLKRKDAKQRSRRRGVCRAVELQQDAPLAIAIGACIFNSLLFPDVTTVPSDDEDDVDAAISSTDARFAVMTIISFVPFFNWLSWAFALMDTGKQRYAVYAIVYLAPYIRTNLSLSPEESWLPIASIVLCVIHIQIEGSIRSGDLASFNLFNEVAERFGLIRGKKDSQPRNAGKRHEGGRENKNLPSGQHQIRDEIRKWGMPKKPSKDRDLVNEDDDLDD